MSTPKEVPKRSLVEPVLTLEPTDDGRVKITTTDSETGEYVAHVVLRSSEARRMGEALIGFADKIDGSTQP